MCVCVRASCSFNEHRRCTNEASVAAGRRFWVWEETQVSGLYSLHLFITLIANTPRVESSLRHVRRPRMCSKTPPSYLQINTYRPSAGSLWSCLSCVVVSAALSPTFAQQQPLVVTSVYRRTEFTFSWQHLLSVRLLCDTYTSGKLYQVEISQHLNFWLSKATYGDSYIHKFLLWWWWLQCEMPTSTSGAVWSSASCSRTLWHAAWWSRDSNQRPSNY